jgi:hypothetical protein
MPASELRSSFPSYSLLLSLAHILMASLDSIPQQNREANTTRSRSSHLSLSQQDTIDVLDQTNEIPSSS